jgi:glycosyl hydrolase family 2
LAYDEGMESHLGSLEVFDSELTPNRAVVQARLPGGELLAGLSLGGFVRGPKCSRGSTLPATYRLVGQVGNLSYVRAQALITEPIYWSPDWPALYDVTVELRRGGAAVETATRTIGLRPLAVAGRNLVDGGKTWVLRAVRSQAPSAAILQKCREHSAALLAPAQSLDDRLLTMASEEGVLLIVQLASANAAAEISRLSRYAAVAITVLPAGSRSSRFAVATNIVLAHPLKQGEIEPPPDDARLVVAEVSDKATFADWASTQHRPVIAFRPLPDSYETAAARAECDRLQRDLAPYGQFAGYIV